MTLPEVSYGDVRCGICGQCIGCECHRLSEPAPLTDPPPYTVNAPPEGREGIVTVYDHEGRYLGCMGIELWRRLLAEALADWNWDKRR